MRGSAGITKWLNQWRYGGAIPEFREDVKRAVHSAMDDRGQLLIENKTTTYRRIFVNRVEYGVQPGETISIDVPVGNVGPVRVDSA